MRATAPGKMMIAGEYAVLEGAASIVAAAQTRGVVELVEGPTDPSKVAAGLDAPTPRFPEAAHARREAERRVGVVPGALVVDVEALRRAGQKLGLGSSAATAAAAAGLVHAWHGRNLEDARVRREVFEDAYAGHKAVSPQGSGADVAAAVLGGVVRFQRTHVSALEGERDGARTDDLKWPTGLVLRVAWTGQAASTTELVAKVKALETSAPTKYRDAMDALGREAERFVMAFSRGAAEVVAAAARYHDAMETLGKAAGAPIVEARLSRVAELAARAGGHAKPSGAGGGDVALAFFAREAAAKRFEELCAGAGIEILPIELGGPGVRAAR
jgi:phosphomevalonate kinase